MSISRIHTSLDIQLQAPPQSKRIELKFTEAFSAKAARLGLCVDESKLEEKDNTEEKRKVHVSEILRRLQIAETVAKRIKTSEEKATLEEYNLQLMTCFLAHLQQYPGNKPKLPTTATPPQKKYTLTRRVLFGFLTFISMSADGVNSFLFFESLLALIPYILNPVLFTCSAVCTALNAVLFYGFEANMLKKALKVPKVNNATQTFVKNLNQQVTTTHAINELLGKTLIQIPATDLSAYRSLAIAFNKKISSMKKTLPSKQENNYHKCARMFITGFGVVTTIASGYFYSAALLATFAVGLLGTPVGWMIIGSVIAISLVMFAAMRASGALRMRSATLAAVEKLDQKLDAFEEQIEKDFDEIINNKRLIEVGKRAEQTEQKKAAAITLRFQPHQSPSEEKYAQSHSSSRTSVSA